MTLRQDDSISITLPSIEQFNSRADIRDYLLRQWISETPQTKYRYFVETFNNNKQIYLERKPGMINRGCDFIIYIDDLIVYKNGNDKPPNHDFIKDDLTQKKNNMTAREWSNFMLAVEIIYNCGTYADTIQHTVSLPLIGFSYELSLKLIRWFFIEQDITYWSGQGREMFYNGIQNL